jgi:hypothetical protein
MKLIAHRGLTNGPDVNLENRPDQIKLSLKEGFDCEIDLWVENSELWLGHDGPEYHIREDFLNELGLWIHAKNLSALRWLTNTQLNYFWHQNDDYVITSHKWIWTYPGKDLTACSICVMPEWKNPTLDGIKDLTCYGVCSDFVGKLK